MKMFRTIFVVAIATFFMVGNVYADNVGIDLNSGGLKVELYKHYTIGSNLIEPANNTKISDVLLGTENIDITWLPNENVAGTYGSFQGSGQIKIAPLMSFTKADFKNFKGVYAVKTINNVQFSINGAAISEITGAVLLVLTAENGGNLNIKVQQQIATSSLVNGWNTVALNTPLQITDAIDVCYIGYGLTYDVSVAPFNVGTPATDKQRGLLVDEGTGWQGVYNLDKNFLIKAGATADKSDYQINAHFAGINIVPYALPGAKIPIVCNIANWGANNITSMEFSCKLGDEEPQILTLPNVSDWTPGKTLLINGEVTVPSNHTAGNSYPLVVTITKVNGLEGDDDMSDNIQSSMYSIISRQVQRTVLHEGFTASTCGPCKPGNENLKSVQNANTSKYATIKYQTGGPSPGDPYYTSEVAERLSYYGSLVQGVPWLFVNGISWNGNTQTYTSQILNTNYIILAYGELLNAEAKINDAKKVTFSVELKPVVVTNLNNISTRLFAAIIEKKTTKNRKTNGETEFENVMKKFLTPATGTPVGAMQPEATKKFDLEWTFKGNYRLPQDATNPINNDVEHSVEDFENLAVVYWVQDFESGVVFQSGVIDISPVSIAPEYALINSIFPNPVKDHLTIDIKESAKVSIWSLEGDLLYECEHIEGISTIKLNAVAGTYILRTANKNGSHSTKFVVE